MTHEQVFWLIAIVALSALWWMIPPNDPFELA